jgi:membrane protein DedA with SNARE-associated domain
MIAQLLAILSSFIIAVVSAMGYTGIFFLMALENVFMILPSEVILAYAGYLVLTGEFDLWLVTTIAALGCNIGSSFVYYISAKGARPILMRYGKYVLVSRRDIQRADEWFERYGQWAVFFCRMVPMLRSLIAIPAGVARMNFWKFNLYTFLGSWPFSFALTYAGYALGEHWPTLEVYIQEFDHIIAVILLAGFAAYVWRHWKHRTAERALEADEGVRSAE